MRASGKKLPKSVIKRFVRTMSHSAGCTITKESDPIYADTPHVRLSVHVLVKEADFLNWLERTVGKGGQR